MIGSSFRNDSSGRRGLGRGLSGKAVGTASGERSLHPSLVATYRLRVVAVGALIVSAALVNFVIYFALPGHGRLDIGGFLAVTLLGIAMLTCVVFTPWNRVLVTRWGMRVLYSWSVCGIVVVTAAVYADGGSESVLFVFYPVLTVFFAIAYPRVVQAWLFVLTIGAYCVAIAARGWNVEAGALYVRITSLGIVAYVTSVLSGWLVSEMRDRARSTSAADQRAGMVDTVARAARKVSSLDASQVLHGALGGAIELGCSQAEIWLLDTDSDELVLQRRIAVDMTVPDDMATRQTFDQANKTGTTQIVEDGPDHLIGCLLHREREAVGLLIARLAEGDASDSLVIECMELLAAQVSAGLDVARNIAERKCLEERLAHWAFHDNLTDLPNRVLFADRLEQALARIERGRLKVAVLFLDLDGFKEVNDSLGHGAGDALLRKVSDRLQGSLRPEDTLARYGGDEFVVLVEQVDGADAAVLVADRILEALVTPIAVQGSELSVSASIGIALTEAGPAAETDVMRRADIAMYQAKTAGGARYVVSGAIPGPADIQTDEAAS